MSRTSWDSNEVTQRVEPSLPALSVGTNDIVVSWPLPFADASYCVQATAHVSAATIGGVSAGVKLSTRTTTGCTVTVVNTTLVTIGAGGTLMVSATGSL